MRRVWLLPAILILGTACGSSAPIAAGACDREEAHHREDARSKDRADFVAWVKTSLYQAELALHNGDPGPRRALWSRREPVSVLGARRNAHGQKEVDALFAELGKTFSNCTSYTFELQAYDVVGDMAYTAGLEHTSVTESTAQ